jgi:hypothetical protein
MEPDPVEWAHFLLCLVATGRTRQAMRYLKKYPDLQHPELSRMVRALLGIFDNANGAGVARPSAPQFQRGARKRASIHSMPLQSDAQWNTWLAGSLRACGRLREAALLDAAAARDASERNGLGQARAPQPAAALANGGAGPPARPANAWSRGFRPVGNDLQTQLARAKRLLMRGLKPLARLLPEAFGQSRSMTPSQVFLCSVRDLLQQEPVASAICIGAAAQSPLTRTFIDGLRTNPNAVNLVLAEGSPKADWGGEGPPSGRFTRTELAQLLRKAEGPRPNVAGLPPPTTMAAFDLMAVDFSHAPHFELDAAGMSPSLFVLSGLCTRNGHSANEWLMRSNDYALVQFDALSENGYAVFRKRHWAQASNGHSQRAQVTLPKFGVVS